MKSFARDYFDFMFRETKLGWVALGLSILSIWLAYSSIQKLEASHHACVYECSQIENSDMKH